MNRTYCVCGWCLHIFRRHWQWISSWICVTLRIQFRHVSPRSQSATPFQVLMCLGAVCIFFIVFSILQLQCKMGFFQKTCFAIPLHVSFPFPSPSILLASPESLQARCFIFLSMDRHLICDCWQYHIISLGKIWNTTNKNIGRYPKIVSVSPKLRNPRFIKLSGRIPVFNSEPQK